MGEMIKALMGDTKKLGRIVALVIILSIAGIISIKIVSNIDDPGNVLNQWIDLAKIAIMFYFMKTMDKNE